MTCDWSDLNDDVEIMPDFWVIHGIGPVNLYNCMEIGKKKHGKQMLRPVNHTKIMCILEGQS